MTALFRKIDCLSLPVTDLDAALAFYSAKLGHELIWRSRTAAGLRLPDSNAELVLHTDTRPLETDLSVQSVPEEGQHVPAGTSRRGRAGARCG